MALSQNESLNISIRRSYERERVDGHVPVIPNRSSHAERSLQRREKTPEARLQPTVEVGRDKDTGGFADDFPPRDKTKIPRVVAVVPIVAHHEEFLRRHANGTEIPHRRHAWYRHDGMSPRAEHLMREHRMAELGNRHVTRELRGEWRIILADSVQKKNIVPEFDGVAGH